jgi:hypothetical protein
VCRRLTSLPRPSLTPRVGRGTLRPHAGLVERFKAAGEIPPEVDAEALARVMVALFQGLVLQKCRDKDLDSQAYLQAIWFLVSRLRTPAPRRSRCGETT